MENMELQQRVWERVRMQAEGARGMELEDLWREAAALEQVYRVLATGLWQRDALLGLARTEQRICRCLRGIARIHAQLLKTVSAPPPVREERQKQLLRCYHRTRRLMGEYAARSATPETGLVFAALARMAEDNCLRLAQLLGAPER